MDGLREYLLELVVVVVVVGIQMNKVSKRNRDETYLQKGKCYFLKKTIKYILDE